jgi:hypothetical protein
MSKSFVREFTCWILKLVFVKFSILYGGAYEISLKITKSVFLSSVMDTERMMLSFSY